MNTRAALQLVPSNGTITNLELLSCCVLDRILSLAYKQPLPPSGNDSHQRISFVYTRHW